MQFLTGLTSACISSVVYYVYGQPAKDKEAANTSSSSTTSPATTVQPSWAACRQGKALSTYYYCLSTGFRWALATWQMSVYVCLLLPGFLQMVAFYIFSPRIAKNVRYGSGSRQLLDLYWPQGAARSAAGPGNKQQLAVVIYITGGAWLLGYKAWGAILARRLSQQGVLVACVDYRNFPQACAMQMLEDVNTAVAWVISNIQDHGGDAGNITLVGQSAGAHLGALALFSQAEQVATGTASLLACPRWSPKGLRAFVSLSGIYDLPSLSQHLQQRGFGRNLLDPVMTMDGSPALLEFSPLEAARRWSPGGAVEHLPSITLVHGTADKSSPHEGACTLYKVLKEQSVSCELQLLDGNGHTTDLLEGPMKGGRDGLVELLLRIAVGRAEAEIYPKLNPEVLCSFAGYICPF